MRETWNELIELSIERIDDAIKKINLASVLLRDTNLLSDKKEIILRQLKEISKEIIHISVKMKNITIDIKGD